MAFATAGNKRKRDNKRGMQGIADVAYTAYKYTPLNAGPGRTENEPSHKSGASGACTLYLPFSLALRLLLAPSAGSWSREKYESVKRLSEAVQGKLDGRLSVREKVKRLLKLCSASRRH